MRVDHLLLCRLFAPPQVFAQIPASQNDTRQGDTRPVIRAQQVSQAPSIDGRLDDAAWEEAQSVLQFYQQEPLEGEAVSEPTRVRILYDETNLYIGVELFDSDPAQIRASELRRDNSLESDDSFAVLLDTLHDHQNAFLFRVNPQGTRFDGVIQDEAGNINSNWDEQWTAEAVMSEDGWSAEMSIPFKILRFSGAREQIWGINFERVIKRKNELAYWSGWTRNFQFHHVSQAGHLEGLSDIKLVERLRIRPYLLAGVERLETGPSTGRRGLWDVGIDDLKFALTSNLTADLALNPDFGQVEVDAQRVNLTRFSLSFREKRQFFIEGADFFRMRVPLLHFGPPPLEVFYSRRIGLSEGGQPISILGGGKLTGKVGGLNLGILNVQTGEDELQPGENFAVARIRKEILGRSYVGAIVTNRQGGGDWKRVTGVDTRLVFKEYLNVAGLLAKSFAPGTASQQWARQLGAEWRDDLLEAGVNYIDIDPDFEPGIGFVRRRDRLIGTRVLFKPRPGGELIRQVIISPSLVYFHNNEKVLRTRITSMRLALLFQSGDQLEFNVENRLERLFKDFAISPGVELPVDLYQWNTAGVSVSSYNGRSFSAGAGVDMGDFYNGTKRSLNLSGEIRPNQNLNFSPSYEFNDIDLLEGAFNTHLFGLRSSISFTNNLLTSAFLQYNSSGDLAALQVRFNYIFRTIDNLFVVYNETRFVDGALVGLSNRSLLVKLTYSLHR